MFKVSYCSLNDTLLFHKPFTDFTLGRGLGSLFSVKSAYLSFNLVHQISKVHAVVTGE